MTTAQEVISKYQTIGKLETPYPIYYKRSKNPDVFTNRPSIERDWIPTKEWIDLLFAKDERCVKVCLDPAVKDLYDDKEDPRIHYIKGLPKFRSATLVHCGWIDDKNGKLLYWLEYGALLDVTY